MHRFYLLLMYIIIMGFLIGASLEAKPVIHLNITKGLQKRTTLAFPQGSLGTKTFEFIKRDLMLSGRIRLINVSLKESPKDPKKLSSLNYNYLIGQGAEFALWVEEKNILGVPKVSYYLHNCGRRRLKKDGFRSGAKEKITQWGHQLTDEIIQHLTGKPGLGMTRIAYVSDKIGQKTIFSSDIQGLGEKQLVFTKAMVLSPHYGPRGKQLLYTSYQDVNPGIFLKDLLTNKVRKIASFPGLNANGKINSQGEVVFTASKDGNPELYLKNIYSGRVSRLTKRRGVDANADWSRDGKRIAFVSSAQGGAQVFLMKKNGRNIERLTYTGTYNTSPAFSPDGRYLAYVTRVRGTMQLALYDFRKKETKIIVSGRSDSEGPVFSPQGKHIAYASKKHGIWNIYIVDIETQEIFQVTRDSGNCTNPSWA